MTVSYDLLFALRETQLQHGLRSDDFAKYHRYLTGRIKTLRKQLKLTSPHKGPKKRGSSQKRAGSSSSSSSKKHHHHSQQRGQSANSKKEKKIPTYVPPKKVLPESATAQDPRSIMYLALLVERSWAESEELRHASAVMATNESIRGGGKNKNPSSAATAAAGGGSGSSAAASGGGEVTLVRHHRTSGEVGRHGRSRLSRATQYTSKLLEVVNSVGDETLKKQTAAYVKAMHGRNEFTHGNFEKAKEYFLEARALFHELVIIASSTSNSSSSNSSSSSSTQNAKSSKKKNKVANSNAAASNEKDNPTQILATELRTECDDRIITCIRRLGQDPSSYRPVFTLTTSGSGGEQKEQQQQQAKNAFGTLKWIGGREVPVTNSQIQNALRRFDAIDALQTAVNVVEGASSVEELNGIDGVAWWIFQQQSLFNKQQECFDRSVGTLNDAMDGVTSEITNLSSSSSAFKAAAAAASSSASTKELTSTLRLSEHCLKFRSLICVAVRSYFAAWSQGARFLLSTELLQQSQNSSSSSSSSAEQHQQQKKQEEEKQQLSQKQQKEKSKQQQQQQQQPSAQHHHHQEQQLRLPSKRLEGLKDSTSINKELPFANQHVVSPVDVIKLFDLVLNALEDASLLPGVDQNESETALDILRDRVKADRLFFIGKGWEIVFQTTGSQEALSRCLSALTHAENLVSKLFANSQTSQKHCEIWFKNFGFECPILKFSGSLLKRRIIAARTSASALSSSPTSSSSSTNNNEEADVLQIASRKNKKHTGKRQIDLRKGDVDIEAEEGEGEEVEKNQEKKKKKKKQVAGDALGEFSVCSAFTEFPPDFQVAPCKAAFVDIAGTYAEDYLHEEEEEGGEEGRHQQQTGQEKRGGTGEQTTQEQPQQQPAQTRPARQQEGEKPKEAEGEKAQQKGWFSGWF